MLFHTLRILQIVTALAQEPGTNQLDNRMDARFVLQLNTFTQLQEYAHSVTSMPH